MSFNFSGLPSTTFPTPTNPVAKDLQCKVIKLTSADFTTGGTASVKGYIPGDASIVRLSSWVKTQLAGNGITAAALNIGITGTTTKYAANISVFGIAGAYAVFSAAVTNLMAEYDPTVPGGDIPLLFTGTATTGNPTSGELYVLIEYVR